MKDTPKAMEDLYRTLLMKRSGVERLKMGCAMFDASRVLTQASLQADLHTDEDIKIRLFIRTYGADIEPETVERISKKFSTHPGQPTS